MCIQYTQSVDIRRVAVVDGELVTQSHTRVSLIPEWPLTSSLRLFRTELKKYKLNHCFCSNTKQ